ncbi:MAG: RCC1 domain-containing protein [bacterium]
MFKIRWLFFILSLLILNSCEKENLPVEEIIDLCEPNPCSDIEWSNGECLNILEGYECGCVENFKWNGSDCEGETRVVSCMGLPENGLWNSADEITQQWSGDKWEPSETGTYSHVESTEYCRFRCNIGYGWENGACVLKWEMVALGAGHTCGIKNSSLFCWGNAYRGKLGNGDIKDYRTKPVQVLFDPEIISKKDGLWKSVSAGTGHTCGILHNGELYCWGDNEWSQIGDGTNEDRPFPVRILAQEDIKFVKISTRYEHTCAINSTGELFCWGKNDLGALGDGTEVDRKHPVKIGENIGQWVDVSAGGAHTCAINSNGELYCWGLNSRGQFGNNSHVFKSLSPVKVNEETDWKMIATGGVHTCAIKENGKLYCWGGNDRGEVGDGNVCPEGYDFCADRYSPVLIEANHKWSYISIGYRNNAAKREDGLFFVWGKNDYYSLGDGTDIGRPFPVEMKKNSWETVTLGGSWNYGLHTCAIDEQKDLYCWGTNLSGQLGTGTTNDRKVPSKVEIPEY